MSGKRSTFQVTYTADIVRDAVNTFVWKRAIANPKLWGGEFVLAGILAWTVWAGERGWLIGFLAATLLIAPVLVITVWIAHYRNTVGKFRAMRSPVAKITLCDDGVSVSSALGSASFPWQQLTEIWERPSYWMIFTATSAFFTLPIDTVSSDDLDLMRSKIGGAHRA